MERKRPVFARRPLQFPPRYPRSCAKTRTHCRHTFRANPFSRGRSVSKKRSIRGKSNHGSILRQPCRYYLKGTCARAPCECWHPPECQFHKTKTGCKSGDTCLFPHHKVDEQPKERPKNGYFPKRRESEDKGAVAVVKSVSQLGCVLQDSDALEFSCHERVSGKPDAKRLKRNSKSSIHKVHATSREYPGQEKTIAWKNTSQTSPSAKSLRCKIRGSVPRRD